MPSCLQVVLKPCGTGQSISKFNWPSLPTLYYGRVCVYGVILVWIPDCLRFYYVVTSITPCWSCSTILSASLDTPSFICTVPKARLQECRNSSAESSTILAHPESKIELCPTHHLSRSCTRTRVRFSPTACQSTRSPSLQLPLCDPCRRGRRILDEWYVRPSLLSLIYVP